jgi:hypothetical protein
MSHCIAFRLLGNGEMAGELTGAELLERLEETLAPWLPHEPEPLSKGESYRPRTTDAPLAARERKRYEAYAHAKLKQRCTELAAMGKDSGRNTTAFSIAAAIGRYVHHGIIKEAEAVEAITAACRSNGLLKEDGPHAIQATIRSGLLKARNDQLPELQDRSRTPKTTPSTKTESASSEHRVPLEDSNAPRIRLVPFSDIRLSRERRDLVARLISRVGLTVVWGPPKCGKSFWVFDLMMHVVLDREYRGKRVHHGPVVYCAFEGQTGIEARVEAFRQKFMAEDSEAPPFYLEPVTLNLVSEHLQLIEAIQRQLPEGKPVAVVLDTLNRSMQGSESNDEDMSLYVKAADAIRQAFGCAVIVVHHCGIDDRRPRGHTSLTGAADAQLAVRRDGAENIVVEVEFAKDGAQGESIVSRLEALEVGQDEDGEPITSCVIVPVEGNVILFPKAKRRLTDGAKIALKALQLAISEVGEIVQSSEIPATVKTITKAVWRRYAEARGISGSEKDDARRMAFNRAVERLVADGWAGMWDERWG